MRSQDRIRHVMPLVVVVVTVSAFVFFCLSAVVPLKRAVTRLQHDVEALWPTGQSGDDGLPSLESVRTLRRDLESLDRELRSLQKASTWFVRPLARQTLWRWLSIRAALLVEGLSATVDLTTTAWWTVLTVESAIESHGQINTASGVPVEMTADLVECTLSALRMNRERLFRARQAMSQVSSGIDALGSRSRVHQNWKQHADLALFLIDTLLVTPSALGSEREQTYLLLIQNSDEIRATGGFISSVAVLNFQGHRLVSARYMNSYDVEAYRSAHPPPPSPLREYMQAGVLLFRDANWSPDYPTSAEVLASLYQLDMEEEVDGVIAIDTSFVRLLLAALGPLSVPKYNVTITADNVVETTIAFWENPLDAPSIRERHKEFRGWLDHRKDFGGALLDSGLQRFTDLSSQDVVRVISAVHEAIQGKHLLIWP